MNEKKNPTLFATMSMRCYKFGVNHEKQRGSQWVQQVKEVTKHRPP